jgi:hypothetical protein
MDFLPFDSRMIDSRAGRQGGDVLEQVRRLLLAIFAVGAVGLAAELALLGHYEEWRQIVPVALLGASLVALGWLWGGPSRASVATFRAVMGFCLLAGVVGMWFHFNGNREFELEMDATMAGWALFSEAMSGATPALAPGALVQLALIGLAATFRHPAAGTRGTPLREVSDR